MRLNKRIIEKILDVVYGNPFGVTLEDIVSSTGHHRATIQKYVGVLESMGFVFVRRLGNYVIVYPRNIAEYLKYNFSDAFLDALISAFSEKFGVSKDSYFDLGARVAKFFSESIIEVIRENMRSVINRIGDVTDIYIPAVTPNFKIRIRNFDLADLVLYVEIFGMKTYNMSAEVYCQFFGGYIYGMMRALGIPVKDVKVIDSTKSNDSIKCRYVVVLEVPLRTAIKLLDRSNINR